MFVQIGIFMKQVFEKQKVGYLDKVQFNTIISNGRSAIYYM